MTKKMTSGAMLVALAMIFSYIESILPIHFGIPGIKLGLANLVVVLALYLLSAKWAFTISIVRIILVAITFGNVSLGIYSLAGGILSLSIMYLLHKGKSFSVVGVSVAGGVFHNIGQLLIAILAVSNLNLILYLPILLLVGAVTGYAIGTLAILFIPRILEIQSKNEDNSLDR